MRKLQQSQQSQSSVSVDIHRQTAQRESGIITTEGCRSNSSTFGFPRALHCDVDLPVSQVHCPEKLLELVDFWPWGRNGLAGVSGYLGLSSSYRTKWGGGDEPLSALSLLRLEGQGQECRRAVQTEGLSPAGLLLQSFLLQPPSMFLTDSYLPAAGHAPWHSAADKMLM